MVAVPNLLLAVAAAVHLTLMRRKAQIEEQFLAGEFGDAWQVYASRTGRFLPRRAPVTVARPHLLNHARRQPASRTHQGSGTSSR